MNAYTTNPYMMQATPALAQTGAQIAYPQTMTMPTIHADIIQTNDESYIERYPIGDGQAQMFMTTDESRITIKSASSGGTSKTVYERKETHSISPEFVRRDEIAGLIEAALAKREEAAE